MKADIAVAEAVVHGYPIKVGVAVILGDGEILWTASTAHPISEYGLAMAKRDIQRTRIEMKRNWPEAFEAVDWGDFILRASHKQPAPLPEKA